MIRQDEQHDEILGAGGRKLKEMPCGEFVGAITDPPEKINLSLPVSLAAAGIGAVIFLFPGLTNPFWEAAATLALIVGLLGVLHNLTDK